MNLPETFKRTKVHYAFAPVSCVQCLSFLSFFQFSQALNALCSYFFFPIEATKKCESHGQCVKHPNTSENNITLSYENNHSISRSHV